MRQAGNSGGEMPDNRRTHLPALPLPTKTVSPTCAWKSNCAVSRARNVRVMTMTEVAGTRADKIICIQLPGVGQFHVQDIRYQDDRASRLKLLPGFNQQCGRQRKGGGAGYNLLAASKQNSPGRSYPRSGLTCPFYKEHRYATAYTTAGL